MTHRSLASPEEFSLLPKSRTVFIWFVLLAYAMVWDAPVRPWLRPTERWVEDQSIFFRTSKSIGEIWVILVVMIGLSLFHAWRWRAAAMVLVAVLGAQVLTHLLKWVSGRTRPGVLDRGPFEWDWFRGGLTGVLDQTNLALPSGHAGTIVAVAAVLYWLIPRGLPIWATLAALCCIERVASFSHWPSDVVAGAMVGILSARFAFWFGFRLTRQTAAGERSLA
jgi:membrane-associated phospholipid phosphatase